MIHYIDANVWIYAIIDHPKYGEKCREILEGVKVGKVKAATCFEVCFEACQGFACLSKPKRSTSCTSIVRREHDLHNKKEES